MTLTVTAARIRTARQQAGLTQTELANLAEVALRTVQYAERGTSVSTLMRRHLLAIAEAARDQSLTSSPLSRSASG